MKDKLPRYTMRIERELLDKLQYIAKYEGRTANKQLEQLVKRCIREFEKDNGTITEDMTYYYFYVESNTVCPICFKSEVTETKKGQCPNDEYELYTSEVKETAECVIKSLKTSSSSELIVNDNSNFLLFKNSALEEDQNLLNIYNIEENIPINYKEQGDDLVTTNTRYNYCEKKNDDDDSLGGGYIALIVILCLIVVAVAGIIVWKFVLKRNSDAEITKPNVTEMNLKDVYTE